MILLAEHDEPSLAAKKKQRHVALEKATSTPKNRVWGFENDPPGQNSFEADLSAETATGSVQFSYETASGQAYYYTRDHLGSVREMCNSSGAIVARYSYDPYGRTTLVSGSNLATFQYAHTYAHQVSGLMLTKYRAYDASTGRWLSRDPIQEKGGLNLYGYAGDNPVDFEDPSGLYIAPPPPVPPPVLVPAALALIDLAAIIYDIDQIDQIIDSEIQIQQMNAAAQKQADYSCYKARCNESPPPGLTGCALARWKLARNQDCIRLRQNFTQKYYPNGGDAGHQNVIDQLNVANAKLEAWIKKNCP